MKQLFFNVLLLLAFIGSAQAQKTVDEYIQQGLELHDAGNYDQAIKMYEQAVKLDASASVALYEMAFSYFAKGAFLKSIKYADKVIDAKQGYRKEAYLVKGSALDNLGQVEEAIVIYEKGVNQFPYDYLLYYNLGIANYNLRNFAKSETALLKALELNPDHNSSHLMLAYLKTNEGKTVQAILPLYTFLLLEADSERSLDAYALLKELLLKGSENRVGQSKNRLIVVDTLENEFSTEDLYVSMLQAANKLEANQSKTEMENFVEFTQKLILLLKENRKGKNGFWWTFYVDLFERLEKAGHLEAYCYYVSHQSGTEEVISWLENNKDQLENLAQWLSE